VSSPLKEFLSSLARINSLALAVTGKAYTKSYTSLLMYANQAWLNQKSLFEQKDVANGQSSLAKFYS
jgi:hypothetical protein